MNLLQNFELVVIKYLYLVRWLALAVRLLIDK